MTAAIETASLSRRGFTRAALAIAASLATDYAAAKPAAVASDETFWSRVRAAYERDPVIVNLNNGGVAPAPRSVLEAEIRYLRHSNLAPAYTMWNDLEPRIETVRTRLAAEWGVDREEIAITRNASESLEIAQQGIRLERGDEVVTTNQDYPRMLTTWDQRRRREGIAVRQLSFSLPVRSSDDLYEMFERAIGPRTRVLHFCHITNLSGQIFPTRRICDMARARGVQTIVDGAHAFAHFPFRLSDLNCDYYGTSLHKWLSAPIGTGVLYVRRERIADLWPLMAAPESMRDNVRKFEEIGTHPAANHDAIAEALDFYRFVGPERKAARLRLLRTRWSEPLGQLPRARLLTNPAPEQSCGIGLIHFEADPGKFCDEIFKRHKILVTPIVHPEFNGIRVTPNVYTSDEEIERFVWAARRVLAQA